MVKEVTDYRVLLNYLLKPVHFASPTNVPVVLNNKNMTMLVL